MFGKVGGHLQRRVEGYVKPQLVADGVTHLAAPRDDLAHIRLKDARRIVHRTTLQTRERQNGSVSRFDTLTEFGTHGAFVANHVGPSAAETSRSYRLVRVHHDMMFGSLHDGIVVVVVDGLAIVALAEGDDGAHITAFHGIVAVLVHQGVGFLHPTLIVDSGG